MLVTRCLKQIALENIDDYPRECDIMLEDIYKSDLITGALDLVTAVNLRKHLVKILKSGGRELRKFCSSGSRVTADLMTAKETTEYVVTDTET